MAPRSGEACLLGSDCETMSCSFSKPQKTMTSSGNGNAETVQVKNSAKPITLRSGTVISAINNAWDHQERNKPLAIVYRFTTIAAAGIESGSPFGRGIAGIELWEKARQSTNRAESVEAAREIAQFLDDQPQLSDKVRRFLKNSDAEQILDRIIGPIIWDTNAFSVPEVIKDITDRLIYIGRTAGVDAKTSEAIANVLFEIAFRKSTTPKDRCLTRADLYRTFHERTHIQVPVGNFMKWLFRYADSAFGSKALEEAHGVPASVRADGQTTPSMDQLPPTSTPGSRLAVILGDVLDGQQAIARATFHEQMRHWRSKYREAHGTANASEFRAMEHEHAVILLNELPGHISEPYRTLAGLRPATIISLYRIPFSNGRFQPIGGRTTDSDLITFDLGPGHNDLYLLGGSATLGVSLIISDEGDMALAERLAVLGRGFRDKLAMCDVLAVGIDETQFPMQSLLRTMFNHRTERDGEITFVASNVSSDFLTKWNAKQAVEPIAAALGAFGVAPRLLARPSSRQDAPPPPRPFKYLDYYTSDDSIIFKGREEDAEQIVREIKASIGRITVLTGRSGVGKTSIIKAAIAPFLEARHDCLTVYARCGAVPEHSIIAACEERTGRAIGAKSATPDRFKQSLRSCS